MQRRRPAEEHSRRGGHDEREGTDAQVEIEVGPGGDLIAGGGNQDAERPVAERQAGRTADRGEDDVLDEQLAGEARCGWRRRRA